MNRAGARAAVLGAAVFFSTGGAAIKACGLSGWQVASFRSAVAGLAVACFLPASRRGWSARTWLVGSAYAATLVLFVLANKSTTAANAIFLQSTAPLYVLVLAPLFLRERIARQDFGLMAAIVGGLALFFVGTPAVQETAPAPLLGNVYGAIAGVTWALTLLGLRAVSRGKTDDGGLNAVVAGNLIAALVALPMALTTAWVPITLPDASLILYLGVVQVGLSYVLLTRGFRQVPAFEASLLILLEPTLSPLWAWLVHGEVPGALALTGGGVILAASFVKTWIDSRSSSLP